ncbi:unnamed protein product [Pedinophyceae sp. YPF-701]|nr:unnamed protein product [Pedinophyceae sp. YPF-701]
MKRKAASIAQAEPVDEADPGFRNKEKVLVLCSRGITFRFRHLMTDIMQLLPHSRKDSKLDTKTDRGLINEVADMKNCTSAMFFEARKRKDLYLWLARTPEGPTMKFHVTNIHTMGELRLSGNHLKGSRPVLSFDQSFDSEPHLQLLKEQLTQVFATPRGNKRSKPFFDHVLSFTWADGRVWFRNYQVVVPEDKGKNDFSDTSLVEVGPRFSLQLIKAFAGSFGGPTIYENPDYVSPNAIRTQLKKQAGSKYGSKVKAKEGLKARRVANVREPDPLEYNTLFKDG